MTVASGQPRATTVAPSRRPVRHPRVAGLSIPWPMMLAQVVMAVLAGSTRRPLALLGSGFVTLALLAGVVSGFFDGGYAEDRFTTFERIYQLGFVVAIVVVGVIAATRFVRVLRPAKARVGTFRRR